MVSVLRRTVIGLCHARRGVEALSLLADVRRRAELRAAAPADRIAYWRLLGHSLLVSGQLRRSAAAFQHMLWLMRCNGIKPGPDDWGPLAAAYRALWRQTDNLAYYRRYLRFTCEASDATQIELAYRALVELHRTPQRSIRT